MKKCSIFSFFLLAMIVIITSGCDGDSQITPIAIAVDNTATYKMDSNAEVEVPFHILPEDTHVTGLTLLYPGEMTWISEVGIPQPSVAIKTIKKNGNKQGDWIAVIQLTKADGSVFTPGDRSCSLEISLELHLKNSTSAAFKCSYHSKSGQ